MTNTIVTIRDILPINNIVRHTNNNINNFSRDTFQGDRSVIFQSVIIPWYQVIVILLFA